MKYTLGIDVGGTKIASGLVDENHNVIEVKIDETSQFDLSTQLLDLIATYDGKFEAIGLGMPGQVLKNGTVTRLPNVKNYKPTNFKQLVEGKFNKSTTVLNDSKAFALAQAIAGDGQNSRVVAGVILGTGIGAGIIVDKKIYYGKDGIAGEMEHIVLLNDRMLRDQRHEVGEFRIAEDSRKYLKTLLGMVVLSWNPDIIVLGGAWSKLSGMEGMANQLTENVGGYVNQTPVKVSQLKNAGVIGAAIAALNE